MSTAFQQQDSSDLSDSMRKPAEGQVNVDWSERWFSGVAGLGLLAAARRRGDKLGLVSALVGGGLLYRAWTGRCSVYQALGKYGLHPYGPATGVRARHGVRVDRSLIINQPAQTIYDFWRNFRNLPQIIDHLQSVVEDGKRSHWVACGPLNTSIEWDAEIVDERPGELLAWRSIPGSQLDTAGTLKLEPLSHGRGTAVRLILKYDPPGGSAGASVASWLGTDVESELFEGLRRVKQIVEAGEMPTTRQQPQGTCSRFTGE